MKNLAVFLFTILTLNCFGAGATISSLNGFGTNTTFSGTTTALNPSNNIRGTLTEGLNPIDFGAVGNGDIFTNVSIAAGQSNLTISGTSQKYANQFTSADVGKKILIYGAGQVAIRSVYYWTNINGVIVTNGPYTTTNCLSSIITNVVSSTSVLISNAALNTISGARNTFAAYGTDDTAAIQSWLNYTTNFWYSAGSNACTLSVPDKIFVIAGPIIDPALSTDNAKLYANHKNSQLQFPDYPLQGDYTRVIKIVGKNKTAEHEGVLAPSTYGSIFWSFYVNTNQYVSYSNNLGAPQLELAYVPSVFECQNWSGEPAFRGQGSDSYTNNFNSFQLYLKDLTLRVPANPAINGWDLRGCTSADVSELLVNTGCRFDNGYIPFVTNASAVILPLVFSDPGSFANDLTINGYWNGLVIGEQAGVGTITVQGCENAIFQNQGGHLNVVTYGIFAGCKNIVYNGGDGGAIVLNTTIEGGNNDGWWMPECILNDWNNGENGIINCRDVNTELWDVGTNTISILGGTNTEVVRYSPEGAGFPYSKVTYVKSHDFHGMFHMSGLLVSTNNGFPVTVRDININPSGNIGFNVSPANDNGQRNIAFRYDGNNKILQIDTGNGGEVRFNDNSGNGVHLMKWMQVNGQQTNSASIYATNFLGNGMGLTNILGDTLMVLATNRLVFTTVSSFTNTLGREATAIVTAGTSVALQDTNGVSIATIGTIATLDVLIPMHVNMRLSGTGVSAILY